MIKVEATFKNLQPGLEIPVDDLVIFTGPNNSGKSAILQFLNISGNFGDKADYVSPRRFDTSNEIAVSLQFDKEQQDQLQERKRFNPALAEVVAPDPVRDLIALGNKERGEIVKWHNRYFGELSVLRSNTGNDFSAPRITIDGRLVSQQGSGSRAVLAILCRLFDPKIEYLFIDEPEIGIEPQVQRRLLELIRKVSKGEDQTPRKKVLLATHSHLFLDKEKIGNNYVVSKDTSGNAEIHQVKTEQELYTLVFRLLGNSPNDLFLPRNIIIVEGPSDRIFLNKILELQNAKAIAIHYADSDERIGAALPAVDQMLKSLSYIPLYRERICIMVDKQKDSKVIDDWRKFLGDDGKRVLELPQNGIEYFYPKSLLAAIAEIPEADVAASLETYLTAIKKGEKDPAFGKFNGGKVALARALTEKMTVDHLAGIDGSITSLAKVANERAWA